ncbi:hypothetical protein BTW10_04025 [Chromohalobacter japonicus]|uniref:Uncharacterized protein n=1 Tax=Chromohalobacter japonicus TaxID=223900 RepID=A0A1Q8TG14_9GAMM|nr:hypothetical protein BTW10_04025 [Chromohalobacter japonicus]
MAYTAEQVTDLLNRLQTVTGDLQALMFSTVVQGQEAAHPRVREHLLHGVARRIDVIGRTINNIFKRFPPDTDRPLAKDSLSDVQINMHAFVMNLYGVFDNWAWAFVYRHALENQIPRRGVGLFQNRTTRYLPSVLQRYLGSQDITAWHEDYLKSFRDALAHRVPLYVPPAEFTPGEGERYNLLESKKVGLIKAMEWERLDQIWAEQAEIGRPSFCFIHSYSEDEEPKTILLHPQILSDGMAIVELGNMFIEHWHERS